MHVLVAGCGWLGSAVARRLLARGDGVRALVRTRASAGALEANGIDAAALDLTTASPREIPLLGIDAIVACTSAGGSDDGAYRAVYVDATRTLLEAAQSRGLRAFVLTSSTGVFGQINGCLVNESTEPAPSGATGTILVEAERLVRGAATASLKTCVVRLSGLYGPGRTGMIDRVRSGRIALGDGDDRWMNFCHRDDAVSVVLGALDRGRSGAVYHASDDHPPTRREFIVWMAARYGIEPVDVNGTGPVAERPVRGSHRRIAGLMTRAELGVDLAYPSFREGFDALIPEDRST